MIFLILLCTESTSSHRWEYADTFAAKQLVTQISTYTIDKDEFRIFDGQGQLFDELTDGDTALYRK